MTNPIVEPEVPFVEPIRGGFSDGQIIRIQGYTSHSSERFNINLQTGSDSNADDIGLHISVRLLEGYVARNSLEQGSWGEEQGEGDLPIGLGQKFEILVLCASNDYKVAINGKHFCDFPQRISAKRITHLAISGDLKLALISYEGGDELSKTSANTREGGMYGPSQGAYGPPQGHYGTPQGGYGGYGAPQGGYGPPQGGYGPPQGGYGPPQGAYGPPQGGYGPPPPPGQQPGQDSGFENFLETAGSVIAGAISSGMANKLIGSLTGGDNHQQGHPNTNQPPTNQHQNPTAPQQPQFNLPNFGGQGSVGGLGSVGSLLSSFAEQVLQPKKGDHH